MTAAKDTPNVVDLPSRQNLGSGADRLGDLLKLVRGISLKRINGLVGTLFENVDDALFDLAERAGSNAIQTEFFDGMREVRKKRQLVERLFQEHATKAFSEFADGKLKPAKSEVAPQGSAGLSLVDDVELEESLAVTSMVAKAENRLQRSLYPVNLRLAVLIGGGKVEDANNPIGPAVLGNAFRYSILEFDVNVQVKLIIYKLFDRYVMAALDPIYEEVNSELVRAGVLPQIRHSMPHGDRPPPPAGLDPRTSHGMGHSGHSAPTYYDPAANALQAEIYNTVRSLMANRHAGENYANGGGDSGGGGIGLPGLSPTDLLSALTILQSQSIAMQAKADSVSDAAQAVQQIKRELLDQVSRLSDDTKERRVSNADEDTIDLVGMLFEYILQDRNLPAQMQALFGRLQIPYLKVAILDKHLFAQKSHPARRLLDALAEAGKSWSEESDRDQRLYGRIKAAVETVLRDFDDDVGVFERELAGFTDFVDQHHKRAELAEQRAAEATRGREKLQEARRTSAREILKRIDGRNLPPIVHTVLSRPWANYLVLTLLRQGEGSDEWRNALRFADEFVWSAQPKTNESEHTRLRALLPQLEKALRHGLTTVAYHESDVKQLMQELSQFYRRLLDGQKVETKTAQEVIEGNAGPAAVDADGSGSPEPAAVVTQSPVEEAVLNAGSVEDTAADVLEENDEHVRAVRELKVGTWIEFVDAGDNRERAKLSWISPISAKYLFVNRRGLKVCDKTVAMLASELRLGTATVLEEVPLFDRALDAIVARLRHASDEAESTAPVGPVAPAAT
ncbi:MAG: DUF1631 domain-containing protein [Dokdonella sp.]|uniref:DUF1631 domain-containing protein n=1 Tax=Dokdonella sp. TaxID=2291710 RepID=UPI00326478BE